jgi:hypothetical protein
MAMPLSMSTPQSPVIFPAILDDTSEKRAGSGRFDRKNWFLSEALPG